MTQKNWRPITLLNADYNITSRSIVNKDQTRGVPGRFIGENVALLRDVFYFCTSAGVPAALLS